MHYPVIVLLTSNKRGNVAIELDIIALVGTDHLKLTVEKKHKNLLAASKIVMVL